MSQIKIPVLDLKPQYEQIKDEVQGAINRVLELGQFIMGPDVKLFEQEVAEYSNPKSVVEWTLTPNPLRQAQDRPLPKRERGDGNVTNHLGWLYVGVTQARGVKIRTL